MNRTNLFISYSHQDAEWLNRLRLHLSILEREGIVHLWSDTGIRVGSNWEEELETALKDSKAAVLLLSPAFLASDFIWHFELPRILEHRNDGLDVFPLIVRPCAWRIAPDLARIQARPPGDRALSTGTDGEIDRDLAQFAYEVAERLGRLPDAARPLAGVNASLISGTTWTGTYPGTNRRLRLSVAARQGTQFQGTIQYLDDGAATEIEGQELQRSDTGQDLLFASLVAVYPAFEAAVRFREVRQTQSGKESINLNGEYRALLSRNIMIGNWASGGRILSTFELRRA